MVFDVLCRSIDEMVVVSIVDGCSSNSYDKTLLLCFSEYSPTNRNSQSVFEGETAHPTTEVTRSSATNDQKIYHRSTLLHTWCPESNESIIDISIQFFNTNPLHCSQLLIGLAQYEVVARCRLHPILEIQGNPNSFTTANLRRLLLSLFLLVYI